MLIIGHRGSAGTKPDNSIAGIREAISANADMVEFDVRVTKDKIAVLAHDFHLLRSHKKIDFIRRNTLSELQKRTGGTEMPTVTLEQALKECKGKIIINVEIKELKAVAAVINTIKKSYPRKADWEEVVISSYNPLVLRSVRKRIKHAQLAMLHQFNPYGFMAWQRQLNLSAVGFHRLHINTFALEVAKQLDLFTYAYTVNRADAAHLLEQQGIDAVVTDFPRDMVKKLS